MFTPSKILIQSVETRVTRAAVVDHNPTNGTIEVRTIVHAERRIVLNGAAEIAHVAPQIELEAPRALAHSDAAGEEMSRCEHVLWALAFVVTGILAVALAYAAVYSGLPRGVLLVLPASCSATRKCLLGAATGLKKLGFVVWEILLWAATAALVFTPVAEALARAFKAIFGG